MQKINIEPTTLPEQIVDLNAFIKKALSQNVDGIHFDIMDGKYTEKKAMTFKQAKLCRSLYKHANFSFHIMAKNPKKLVKKFLTLNPRVMFFQVEGCKNIKEAQKILNLKNFNPNTKIGIAIDLNTSLNNEILNLISQTQAVLIMSVKTGKCGQKFNESALSKVKQVKKLYKDIEIFVDGGINNINAKKVIDSGATTLCMGAYLYNAIESNKTNDFLKAINQ